MDFKQIEAFVNVYRLRSFSLAGQAMYLTQPTVSSHINDLENELGVKLFDRSSRDIIPTEAADDFYRYAVSILETRTRAINSLNVYKEKIEGRLELAVSTIPGQYLLPRVMKGFNTLYPHIMFIINQGDTQEVIKEIRQKKFQLGIVGARFADNKLEFETLCSDRLLLITSTDFKGSSHYQIKKKEGTESLITLDELVSMPFIVRERGSATRQEFETALKARGLNPESLSIVAEMNSTEAIKCAVKEGLGVSVVSARSVEDYLELGLIKAFGIEGLNLKRSFYLVTLRGQPLSPNAATFRQFIIEYFQKSSD